MYILKPEVIFESQEMDESRVIMHAALDHQPKSGHHSNPEVELVKRVLTKNPFKAPNPTLIPSYYISV